MRTSVFAVLLAACACARAPLRVGLTPEGAVVEAEGKTLPEARRRAVVAVAEIYVASRTRAQSGAALEKEVFSRADSLIKKSKIIETRGSARVRVLVSYAKLRQALERAGVLSSDLMKGRPRVLLSISETGPGRGVDVGQASGALRVFLIRRGYAVVDLSDRIGGEFKGLGDEEKTRQAPQAKLADVFVIGSARSSPAADERLSSYFPSKAALHVSVSTTGPLASLAEEAVAVDMSAESAAAKALENAGELAGEKIAALLSDKFKERLEITTVIVGLKKLADIGRLVERLRGVESVSDVALDIVSPEAIKLRVYVEKSADELASSLIAMKSYAFRVHSIESDYVELETGAD